MFCWCGFGIVAWLKWNLYSSFFCGLTQNRSGPRAARGTYYIPGHAFFTTKDGLLTSLFSKTMTFQAITARLRDRPLIPGRAHNAASFWAPWHRDAIETREGEGSRLVVFEYALCLLASDGCWCTIPPRWRAGSSFLPRRGVHWDVLIRMCFGDGSPPPIRLPSLSFVFPWSLYASSNTVYVPPGEIVSWM